MMNPRFQQRMAAKETVDDEVISNLFHTLADSKGLPKVQEINSNWNNNNMMMDHLSPPG